MPQSEASQKARVLIEALPYFRQFRTQTMVIKIGGSIMDDEAMLRLLVKDVLLMHWTGIKPVLVHGGGKHITQLMARLDMKAEFVEGLRVTDKETMDVTQMVLSGLINKDIVSMIQREGGRAVGVSGRDGNLIRAKKMVKPGVDIGQVGEITAIDTGLLETLDGSGFIPVVSPIGGDGDGVSLNINADTAATEIAVALKAEKLIFITDGNGVLSDLRDPDSVISRIRPEDAPALEAKGLVSKGMIPKIRSSIEALSRGIRSVHIIGGKIPNALLLELFTEAGIGTQFIP
ncbi:MAG: acetylglutamate kinase [Spirochaetes bacterium]|nr:acetylglutamate kinase [Spirochaetota bacterium]